MRRRARPEAPPENRRRQFLSDNRNSRYVESRARSTGYRRAARRGRDDAKIGENAIPARPTDNPLISLETAKEKVCKSLEKFGISLEFPWKSLEILGKAWGHGDRLLNPLTGWRRPLSEALASRRGGRKPPRKPLKANDRRKSAPASVGSAVASAAARCAAPHAERREANPCGARVGARELPLPTQSGPMILASSV
jgi:hypothetical protein